MVLPLPPVYGIGLVLLLLLLMMTGLKVLAGRYKISFELSRKLVHIGMGLVCLSFPWIFDRFWPVLVLSILSIGLFLSIRHILPLKQLLGGVLGGVTRSSWGEVYFPVAVVVLFGLSGRDPVLYGIPMLILTLADAMSAIIGVQYGQARYSTSEGNKTIEGSLTFFMVAFLGTHLPLLLMTQTGRLESVLIAIVMGLLLMMVEAVSTKGTDNLLVPVGAFLFLKIYLAMPVVDLLHRFWVLLLLFAVMLAIHRRSELKGSATLLAGLFLYAFWALGDTVLWVLPPLVVFLVYPFLMPKHSTEHEQFGLLAVLITASAGFVWMLLSKTMTLPGAFLAYATAFASHLAIIGISAKLSKEPDLPTLPLAVKSILLAWGMMILPLAVIFQVFNMGSALSVLVIMALLSMVFLNTQKNLTDFTSSTKRWIQRGLIVFAGSVLSVWFF